MADSKRAHSPELNGNAGAIVKKQRTDEGSVVISAKQPKEVSAACHTVPLKFYSLQMRIHLALQDYLSSCLIK